MNDGNTGYPWSQGDPLLAADLNAAIANSVALAGGMLPLNGSAPMTGPLTLSGNATLPLHAVPLRQVNSLIAATQTADPRVFGVLFNGTNETTIFQNYLNYCRDNALNWQLPADLVADGLTFYTSGKAADGARVLAVNNGQNVQVVTIQYAAADVLTVPSTEYSGWGDLFRGSSQISGLTGRRGQYITIVQNDVCIGRLGSGGVAFNQMVGFVVWSDAGDIYPPLADNLTWPGTGTVVTAQITRHQIEIQGLVVELSDPPGGSPVGERNRVFQVNRCNTTLRGCQVRSTCASVGIQQGFVASSLSSVQFDRCVVDNIRGSGTTNYGYNAGVAAIITLVDCQARKTRRGFDSQSGNMIRIRGGIYDGGIGAHWGHDIDVSGAMIAMNYNGGPQIPLWFAGGNVRVHDCSISLTGASKGVMGVRSDLFEMYGVFELSGNKIFIDNRNNAIGSVSNPFVAMMQITSPGDPTTPYDTLRPVTLPSLIRMVGNWVTMLGPNTESISLLGLMGDYTAMPQTITVDGAVVIEDNRFDLENGLVDGLNNPRLTISAVRPLNQIGGGYRFRIRGLPCLYTWFHCNSTVVNNASRHALLISEITGPTQCFQSAGAFSRVGMTNCLGTINVFIPSGGAGYTPVGDEVIYNVDQSTLSHAFYTMGGVRQQVLLLTNIGTPGYFQVSNGVNSVVAQAQGVGNINFTLQSRGTGYTQLGQAAGPTNVYGTAIAVHGSTSATLDTPALFVGNTTNANTAIYMDAVSGGNRFLRWRTAGVNRWQMYVQDTESGTGNNGGNFYITRFDDVGNSLGNALAITRATGAMTLSGPIGFQGTAAIAKPAVTGAKGSNAALASLLTALANYGLITDSTSA